VFDGNKRIELLLTQQNGYYQKKTAVTLVMTVTIAIVVALSMLVTKIRKQLIRVK
jgi:hypothetical protein